MILSALCFFSGGCVTPGIDPATGQAHYSADTNLTHLAGQIQSGVAVAAPILSLTPAAPLAPFLPPLANGIMGLIVLISGGIAAWKNKQAQTHSDAAAALAAALHSIPGGAEKAIANAAQNNSSAAVAVHLADAANPVQL